MSSTSTHSSNRSEESHACDTRESTRGQQLLRVVHDFVEGDVIDVVPRQFYEHVDGAPTWTVETLLAELGPP